MPEVKRHGGTGGARELGGMPSNAHARMWRAMRAQRSAFKMRELIAIAGVKRIAVEKFIRGLTRAGYLLAERRGPERCYTLIRDTGPCPPRVSRDGRGVALDPNLEVESLRERHRQLLCEIRELEARLSRFGAYVQKFESAVTP
jgi:hypothetical protein